MSDSGAASVVGVEAEDITAICTGLIQLVQCSSCSKPLKAPVGLPCGCTICRPCIPQTHPRTNITYPGTEDRSQGFFCPSACSKSRKPGLDFIPEHCLADCNRDITLGKVVDIIKNYATAHSSSRDPGHDIPIKVHISNQQTSPEESSQEFWIKGSCLVGTYNLMAKGLIPVASAVKCTFNDQDQENSMDLDAEILREIRLAVTKELDCQVCYSLMTDPYTTVCGHTFCRSCVARMLDISNLCPVCRRNLPMILPDDPGNRALNAFSYFIFPERRLSQIRGVPVEQPGASKIDELPLFVCTVSFPSMPTYLHVFEPRYRRMILRVVENGTRRFGSVMLNQTGERTGQSEPCVHARYGTLLEIDRLESLPGGRILIRATGRYRFRVLSSRDYDGCKIGHVQRIDDIRIPFEEMIEAEELSAPKEGQHPKCLNLLSTQELFQICTKFVTKSRSSSSSWLNERLLSGYGEPPTDPAIFPYWFGTVLPIASSEKYSLLSVTTVRGRLKICADWVRQIERDKTVLRSGTRSGFPISALVPFMFMFCIWFLPTLISAILAIFGFSTPEENTNITATTTATATARPSPFTYSFSVFLFDVSFTYYPSGSSSPRNIQDTPGFVYSGFRISQYFSVNLLLGGFLIICVARILRHFIEAIHHNQRATRRIAPGALTASNPSENHGDSNHATEESNANDGTSVNGPQNSDITDPVEPDE
ncbi:ATP-dependent protease (CrgA), putative [Trichophyton verrucosum HKI 0517]|uniref:ATP-dependent protease (CrgA), putative n=1 Tax=Trichophyton verrucosum (strain HKI 0517) TaxID=663202 RepID=D4DBG7_TRIVH|nr:ATP-dependent protease (CrgA), putative [Trichophyton verrucosum HKI 0517]EFE40775.1 ATP-dependent protease (CrgA), putative [Trichophyton verrucosum HKI 0517]